MIKVEDILKNRVTYFKNKDFESIYDIYSRESEFKQYFSSKEMYKDHFFKLIELISPVSVEIYKVLYNNERAEVLYLEKAEHIENNTTVFYYSKAYFVLEDNIWKIEREERESSNKY